jgi:hypothetical protein
MNFKNWLLTESQTPGLWYHGSSKFFDTMANQKGARVYPIGKPDPDFTRPLFFSPSIEFAKMNNKYVYRCTLQSDKLFDHRVLWMDDVKSQWDDDHYTPLAIEMYNFFVPDGDYYSFINAVIKGDWDTIEQPDVVKWIWSKGFDAFVVTGDGEDNVAIKSAAQIKDFRLVDGK